MTMIAPSILAVQDKGLVEGAVIAHEVGAEFVHLDIMDGHFVPNLTYGPPVIRLIRKECKGVFDAHLMVTNPDDIIPELLDIGCEWITVHQEACLHLHRTLTHIREGGAKAGVALNPATPINTIEDILPMIDLICVMSVNPGFAFQKHIEGSAEKISKLSSMVRQAGWKGMIMVDGGVDASNAGSLVLAGADILVAGGAAFRMRKKGEEGHGLSYKEQVRLNIQDLRTACDVAVETGVDPYK